MNTIESTTKQRDGRQPVTVEPTGSTRRPAEQPRLTVRHVDGERYAVQVRGHQLVVDQPVSGGGSDSAPTPVELFVAALASCVAYYAGRYLVRHGLSRDGLAVGARYVMAADRPARVAAVRIELSVPDELPPGRRAALRAVAAHCTVHNTLLDAPEVEIELAAT
ncbi:putative OsmC-like protein [Micromonospora sp. Llam0]|uniref:OsmC family protein n=1 Tax=Micromonospora sp. Llam0 TaxID=2485143 RepID=UPI000FA9A5CF|nr:OsmC family protein [Micromonospora sp. Llam0]ROO59697.1 putative OsmC-like protein [Micromonospora sp. Llam0]